MINRRSNEAAALDGESPVLLTFLAPGLASQ